MNKFCSLLAKQTLQSCVIRGGQFNNFNRIAFSSTSTPPKQPLSKNPKHKTSPLITLLTGDKIEIITLEHAQKLAERRQLKLVSIVDYDAKTSRPVYKMMTGHEYLSEELKKREEKKEARKEQHIKPEKLLTLNSKISEHDLDSKISKCIKWIEKLHEVRVVISGDESEMQKSEKIFGVIEEKMKLCEGRILQKRSKNGVVKFSIMPTIKKTPKEVSDAPPPKKLLDADHLSPELHQVRSFQTMAF